MARKSRANRIPDPVVVPEGERPKMVKIHTHRRLNQVLSKFNPEEDNLEVIIHDSITINIFPRK